MLMNRLSRLVGDRRVAIRRVARETGLSYTAVYELYHDRTTRIDFATIDRLCGYFGVDTQHLLEWHPGGGESDD